MNAKTNAVGKTYYQKHFAFQPTSNCRRKKSNSLTLSHTLKTVAVLSCVIPKQIRTNNLCSSLDIAHSMRHDEDLQRPDTRRCKPPLEIGFFRKYMVRHSKDEKWALVGDKFRGRANFGDR